MLRIYLTNLGKYNEGILQGEWLELPATDEEIESCKERIGINDHYEEMFITDYESDVNGLKVDEFDNLDELNELAEAIEDNTELAEALIYFGYDTAQEIRDNIDNVTYCTTTEGSETEEFAIGYYYAKECGCLNIPEEIESYFDFDAYGRDIMLEGQFFVNENGDIYEFIA